MTGLSDERLAEIRALVLPAETVPWPEPEIAHHAIRDLLAEVDRLRENVKHLLHAEREALAVSAGTDEERIAALKERDEARAMLREVEWVDGECPACKREAQPDYVSMTKWVGHAPDCRLDAAIKGGKGRGTP